MTDVVNKHKERIKCKSCGTINVVDVVENYDSVIDEDDTLSLDGYQQCMKCGCEFDEFDID